MALQLIAPPLAEPVTLADLKSWLRVDPDDTSQDGVISGLAVAARSWCESYTSRRFISQTWRLLMDFFPGYIDMKMAGQKVSSPFVSGSNAILVGLRYAIVLPYPPVQSIVQFRYLDANGGAVVMDPSTAYVADLASNPARLMPPFGQMWPVARVVANAVQIDYVCGHAFGVNVSVQGDQTAITGATFTPQHVGQPISIPYAGGTLDSPGATLNTIIASVDGSGHANTLSPASTTVNGVTAIVGMPNCPAGIGEAVRMAIRFLVTHWYETRIPDGNDIPFAVKAVLSPYRDLRF